MSDGSADTPSLNREGDVEFVRDLCLAARYEGLLKGVFIIWSEGCEIRPHKDVYLHSWWNKNFISHKQLHLFEQHGMYNREGGGFIAYARIMPWLPLLDEIPKTTATSQILTQVEWIDFGPSPQRFSQIQMEIMSRRGAASRTADRIMQISIDSSSRPLAFTGHATSHMDLTEVPKANYYGRGKVRLPATHRGRVQFAFRSFGEGILFTECYNAEHRDVV